MNESTAPGLVPAPAALADELRPWVDALRTALGPGCQAVYLHGSALTPRFDERSDINLLLVVDLLPQAQLEAVAHAVVKGRAAKKRRISPLLLTYEQVRRSVDVFPIEFHDLADRRALLWGHDILAEVRVGHAHLRHQCESELRAKLVGLRQAFVLGGGTPELAGQLLARAAGGTAAIYRGLLTLRGVPDRPEDGAGLCAAVAAHFGVDPAGLAEPFAAHSASPTGDRATARFAAYVSALESLIAAIDALPGA